MDKEQIDAFLKNSTDHAIAKDFPEFQKFFTGEVDYIKANIVNADNQKIDVLHEFKQGELGDVIEVYFKLMLEEQAERTLWGKIKSLFKFKRMPWDRKYLLSSLKKALNSITLRW